MFSIRSLKREGTNVMVRAVAEEALALTSISLFLATVAVWVQVFGVFLARSSDTIGLSEDWAGKVSAGRAPVRRRDGQCGSQSFILVFLRIASAEFRPIAASERPLHGLCLGRVQEFL
jgi:hypothetical protein